MKKEHTFIKDKVKYSYASIEELKSFVGISIKDINIFNYKNNKYMILNLKQYLKVYQQSSKDGYRINHRQKQANEKIEFIKK